MAEPATPTRPGTAGQGEDEDIYYTNPLSKAELDRYAAVRDSHRKERAASLMDLACAAEAKDDAKEAYRLRQEAFRTAPEFALYEIAALRAQLDQERQDYATIVRKVEAERDATREALFHIDLWSQAYPVEVFHEVEKRDWRRADEVLNAAGLSLTRMSASTMRHVVNGVGQIARAALAPRSDDGSAA